MNNPITEIAQQIRDWQTKRGLSDTDLCRKFAGLGSTKTYTRLLKGDTDELDPERWHLEYRQVLTLMEIEDQANPVDEPVYDDLRHMTAARLAVTDALQETGNDRLVIIEGNPGTGKTTAGTAIARRFGRKIVCCEVDEIWKDSPNAMLGGLLLAFEVKNIPPSADLRRTKLIEILNATPVCLLIDEAHHFGPRTLNLVKTIINRTRTVIVWLAIPTLLRRLESAAYEEARQLTCNRLCERVRLGPPDPSDIAKFLERRLSLEPAAARAYAKPLAEKAPNYGNWKFILLVTRAARKLAGKDQVDPDTFAKAISAAQSTR